MSDTIASQSTSYYFCPPRPSSSYLPIVPFLSTSNLMNAFYSSYSSSYVVVSPDTKESTIF
jgi:hypothetical protein